MCYKTVKNEETVELIEQKSRFIGTIKPVETEEQAMELINSIKQKYWDARHNCYAYILKNGNIKKFSDDGEPHSTAGLPMLQTMDKQGLCNCVAVVTRYFGGVLLGTGGLVRAYSGTVSMAVEKSGIIEMVGSFRCLINCPYDGFGKLENLLKDFTVKIEDKQFLDNVKVQFCIPKNEFDAFYKKTADVFFGKLEVEKIKEIYEFYEN